jgi:hypothetical protein
VEEKTAARTAEHRTESAVSESSISVRAFLLDLRWLAPLTVGGMLLLPLLDVGDVQFIEALLLGVCFIVVLGPLVWVGWERAIYTRYARDPALWRFLGGSAVCAVASGAAIVLILNAFGI